MMTKVWVARHSETEWNVQQRMQGRGDSPLTPHGIALAEALGWRCAGLGAQVLLSSPQGRALQTAEIVNRRLPAPLPIQEDAALMEIALGQWEGKRRDEAIAIDPTFANFRNAPEAYVPPPGGERFAEVMARAGGWLDSLPERFPGRIVLAISHSMTIRAMGAVIAGHSVHTLWDEPAVPSCALSCFVWDGAVWHIEAAGDVAHFAELALRAESVL